MDIKIYHTNNIITRSKIQQNRDVLYLYGDNLIRKGLGGQAKEMRYEPNTIGIVTKRYPDNTLKSFIYDTDPDIDYIKSVIDNDFNNVLLALQSGKYRALVIPPIGIGLAKLHINAPKLLNHIQHKLTQF